jgi:low affinity Fe/Cu permease
MSTNNNEPQLLDRDTAYGYVLEQAYNPVFFEKLANDYGITPRNSNEVQAMLDMAAQLRARHDEEQYKQANAGSSLLAAAQQHLNQVLGLEQNSPSTTDRAVKQAAARLATRPEIAHAVMSMHVAATQAMANAQ